jgi:hypothetical protein
MKDYMNGTRSKDERNKRFMQELDQKTWKKSISEKLTVDGKIILK